MNWTMQSLQRMMCGLRGHDAVLLFDCRSAASAADTRQRAGSSSRKPVMQNHWLPMSRTRTQLGSDDGTRFLRHTCEPSESLTSRDDAWTECERTPHACFARGLWLAPTGLHHDTAIDDACVQARG